MEHANTDDDEQIFWSEEEFDDEQIFLSDEEDEVEPSPVPKCIGCPHTECDELMPLSGTVYVGSYTTFHVLDYLYLVR